MNAVGGHIRKLRKKESMTQQMLAERLSVTRQAVSQWENGNTQPDLDTLAAIAGVFGVDMMEVIYGEEQANAAYPAAQLRKKYIIGCIAFVMLALVILLTITFLYPKDPFNFSTDGNISFASYAIIYEELLFYSEPILYLSLPLSVLCGAALKWDFRVNRRRVRLAMLVIALAFTLLYYGLGMTYHGGNLPDFLYGFEIFADNNPVVFLLPGICFWG